MSRISVDAAIDWDGDGDFGDAAEDVSADVLGWTEVAGGDGSTEELGPMTLTLRLRNDEGAYYPDNTTSPLFGVPPYGKEVVVAAVHDSVTYPRFRGRIADFAFVDAAGIPAVEYYCVDGVQGRLLSSVRTPMLRDVTVDEAIGAVLDAAGWPAELRDLDASARVLRFFWAFDLPVWDAVRLAAKQELGGRTYFNRAGEVRFESAMYRSRQQSVATYSRFAAFPPTYRSQDIAERFEYRNAALVADTAETVIFDLDAAREIPPYGTITISGAFSGGATDVQEPVVGSDLHANSESDGSGLVKDGQVSLSNWTAYGGGFTVDVTNHDSDRTWIAGTPRLQVRGKLVRRANDERLITGSIANPLVPGVTLQDEFAFVDDPGPVRAYGRHQLGVRNQLTPRISVSPPPGLTDADIVTILTRGISDRITLADTTGIHPSKINEDFFVEGYEVVYDALEGAIRATWHTLPRQQALGSVFRISPPRASGIVYSRILAPGAAPGDRIGWG